MVKILLTGGTGLLGRNLKIEADRPTHAQLDITLPIKPKQYDLIVHCAAYTDTTKAEIEKEKCFEVNVLGTINLLKAYKNTPFIYISSEYATIPVNYYSITKRMAEDYIIWNHPCYLIIRTLFKPFPYPYNKVFTDQWTQGDTIDKIAPLIDKAIMEWNKKSKLIYVGTGRKTLFELAKASKPDVIGNTTDEWSKITGIKYPKDYI